MSPGDENDSILKPFVRYKQHVDSSVASALDTMFGPLGFDPRRADLTDWEHTPQPFGSQIRSILWSPEYHPAHLRDLPRPVPNDLPQGAESIFTFEDAFEDLLAVSQDQPLPNIYQKFSQRKLLNQVFPKGEPSQFWMRRLDSQGLVPWLNGEQNGRGNRRPLQRREPEPKPQDWDRLHSELAQRRKEAWSAEPRDDTKRGDAPGLADLVKLSLDIIKANPELEKLFGDINREILGDTDRSRPQARGDITPRLNDNNEATLATTDKAEKRHPKTFDEWFDQVQSFQVGGTSTWDAFKKSLNFGREIIETITKEPADGKVQREMNNITDQLKELFEGHGQPERAKGLQTSFTEHTEVDEDGIWHTKTTWITKDAQGNEIDRREDHRVESPPQAPVRSTQEDTTNGRGSDHERGYPADNGEVRKPGWFWK